MNDNVVNAGLGAPGPGNACELSRRQGRGKMENGLEWFGLVDVYERRDTRLDWLEIGQGNIDCVHEHWERGEEVSSGSV